MVTTTPLLLLLDGILSQDEERTSQARKQIQELVPLPQLQASPLRSAYVLESLVESLMTHQAHLAKIGTAHDGSLPLHFAASIGNIRVANLLLDQYRQAASTPNSKGKIPLHYAAREGRTDMVAFMLSKVPETASILSKKGKLALHFAAGEGHTDIVQALIQTHPQGACLPSSKGKVAMHFAARWGHMAIAKELYTLCPGCVSILDYEGSLPLHDAAREGQLEMAQFLVQRYPQGLSKENIRGESPLFPAVRSRNSDLCGYLVRAWPRGGKHVLQRVRADDNVQDWEHDLLDLCLRGAVNNFSDCTRPKYISQNPSQQPFEEISGDCEGFAATLHATLTPPPTLDITLPRSKSPILEDIGSRKKRSSVSDGVSNKRARRGSLDEEARLSALEASSSRRPFHQVHAALACGASSSVLHCVLARYPNQLHIIDGLGKLPLHVAVEHGSDELAQTILNLVWKPYKEACSQRDFLGRLPLHLALMNRADCRIVEVLLDSNPCSGVEHCDIVDNHFIDKLPIYMATECRCNLSTIYMLLRGDPSVVA